jgi:uncharacterized membrane protein
MKVVGVFVRFSCAASSEKLPLLQAIFWNWRIYSNVYELRRQNAFASFTFEGLDYTNFISLGLIISNFDSLMISAPMWIFVFVLWSYGITSAIKGETKPVPLLGSYYQKMAFHI